jgi:hypothetical protein
MTADQLVAEVQAGRLPRDVSVWWPGAADWTPLSSTPLAERLAPAPGNGHAAPPPLQQRPGSGQDDQLDAVFAGLIKGSWDYYHLLEKTQRVDEVLVGALIVSTLDNGYVLIDLTSDGTNHFLRFEQPEQRSRITIAITHLTRSVAQAKVVGQRASVVIGYGEPVKNFGRVWGAIKEEAKSGYIPSAEPGTVTVDADMASSYLYMQVDMFWKLDDYISEDLEIDYGTLTSHVGATIHALRKFLRGRIGE